MSVLSESSQANVLRHEGMRYSLYDGFAAIYNRHFGYFAGRLLPVLEPLLLRHLPERARILDLCCGTGQLAAALTARQFAVTGVDGSGDMLRIARQNAPGASFILGDARTLDMREQFHAAVSTFDSMNHIVTLDELTAVFANMYRALIPGGTFVFDMNMEEGYRARWWGVLQGHDDPIRYVIRAVYCPETKLGRNLVTLERPDTGDRVEITLIERCYAETTVRAALAAAGFGRIRVHDGHRDLNLFGEIGRSFFVCDKSGPRPSHELPERTGRATHAVGRASRYYRDLQTCMADSLWPPESVLRELGGTSKRLQALEEVLRMLPREPYERLKQQTASFDWFIPSEIVLGQVHPFRAAVEATNGGAGAGRHARVVYLSPLLEQQDWAVVITVAVHELAHVILGHRILDVDPDTYERQEEAARDATAHWGFRAVADQARAILEKQVGQMIRRLTPATKWATSGSGGWDLTCTPLV